VILFTQAYFDLVYEPATGGVAFPGDALHIFWVYAKPRVVQVPTITGGEQAQLLVAPEQIIQKDSYLYTCLPSGKFT
jgi:hypothetical protein